MLIEPSVITVLTLIVYFVLTLNVGRARFKYDVKAPATTGDPNFERALRVQQNTLEQIIFFLPLLWIFSYYISATWGFILGMIWVVGRILYAWGYYQAAEKRGPGFGISFLASLGLLGGAIVGLVLSVREFLHNF